MIPCNFNPYCARLRDTESGFAACTDKAEEMLLQTHNNISDIAMMTGFRSLSQFNRTFKAITGTSPREFRKTKPKPEASLIF
ncbi:MAG: helix-turn-helix domain-containing protein [Lentisphaerae bacterium]|nr:helix-turn-helix domain-containing protein [Lentisphaerota bacterium]